MGAHRHFKAYPVGDLAAVKQALLRWVNAFPGGIYLDSNAYVQSGTWECLAAVGVRSFFEAPAGQAFPGFRDFFDQKKDWLFGFLAYDLKNEVEKLRSGNPDGIGFPDLFFFQPETVAGIRTAQNGSPDKGSLEIFSMSAAPDEIFSAILRMMPDAGVPTANGSIPVPLLHLQPRIPKAEYLATVESVRQHIMEGDVYEMNLCQEFFAENAFIDPQVIFERLNAFARAPFSAYLRWHDRYVLCASPERFLRKNGSRLISQPIKGTRRRHADPLEDRNMREQLRFSVKDRAENVMIVDLVRNDLARHCRPGSVRVEELFGVYSFQTVHQMISTVSGQLRPGAHVLDVLRDAFPMGSMTGAPKVMAMELIERYERSRRGVFSGAIGYFTPEGDFDFNVVIRSILYNAAAQYLSCQVGGAIVFDSIAEQEYEECLVKASALLQALGAYI